MLLLAALARSAPTLTADVAGGATWLLGGNGEAYTVGATQRLGVELGVSRRHAVRLSWEHSHHRLVDASGYFLDLAVPATAAVGGRDYQVLEFGAKLGVGPVPRGEGVALLPYTHFGVGIAATDTRLEVASFYGRVPLQSRAVLPLVDLGFGLATRVRPWATLAPELRAQGLLAEDLGEVDGKSNWGVEVRLVPSLSAQVHF